MKILECDVNKQNNLFQSRNHFVITIISQVTT